MTARTAWLRAGLVAAAVIAVDQVTKQLVRDDIARGSRETVISGVIKLTHDTNNGIAFSTFSGAGWLIGVFIAVAVVGLLVYFARNATARWRGWLSVCSSAARWATRSTGSPTAP
jgi:lipoprotein signal peptidase